MNFDKEMIKELIASDYIDTALDRLNEMCSKSNFSNEVIILKQRLINIKKREIKGIISEESRGRETNRICDAVLTLVDLIDDALISDEPNVDSFRLVFAASRSDARWEYYNYSRIFELFFNLDIEYKDIKTYEHLRIKNIVNELGTINETEEWRIKSVPTYFRLDVEEGIFVNWYMRNILERIIKKITIIDISNFHDNPKRLKEALKINRFITCQLGFYFTDLKEQKSKYCNMRKAYYKNKAINIQFTFDPWNCTSSSSTFDSLRKHNVITPILFVKSVHEKDGVLNLNVSCLAIGYYFYDMQLKRFNKYNEE